MLFHASCFCMCYASLCLMLLNALYYYMLYSTPCLILLLVLGFYVIYVAACLMLIYDLCCFMLDAVPSIMLLNHYIMLIRLLYYYMLYIDPHFLAFAAAPCSMLFHAVRRFMLHADLFLILLGLYVAPSLIFRRVLCLMLCCSIMFYRSELNPCFMLIYSGYCSYLMLLHAIYCVIHYVTPFSMLLYAVCRYMLFANPFFVLLHAWCRSMLYTNPCCMQIYTLCWSMLDSFPSVVMLFYASLFLAHCWYFATLYAGPYLTVSGFAILCLKWCCIVVCWFTLC